jgi:hypothetical protein
LFEFPLHHRAAGRAVKPKYSRPQFWLARRIDSLKRRIVRIDAGSSISIGIGTGRVSWEVAQSVLLRQELLK